MWVGGGTRLKIIEAALFGIPVVSTPMGAEGLPFEDPREILLAHDVETMAAKIVAGFSDQKRIKEIGQKTKIKALAQMDFKKTGAMKQPKVAAQHAVRAYEPLAREPCPDWFGLESALVNPPSTTLSLLPSGTNCEWRQLGII